MPISDKVKRCREECRAKYPRLRDRELRHKCLAECSDREEEPPVAGSPCEGEGSLGKNVKNSDGSYSLITPCASGYKSVKATDGKIWCCKEEGEKPPLGDERPPNCEGGQLKGDDECPEGFPKTVFYKGKRWCCLGKAKPGTEGCPEGDYFASEDGTCPEGYVFISRSGKGWEGYKEGSPGRCECSAWCEKSGYGADCKGGKGDGVSGEWQWPEDIGGQYQALMDRLTELLNMPRGLSEAERQAIINFATEGIKGSERGRLEESRGKLARMGVLDETYYSPEEEKIKRQTRQLTSGVQQGVAIDETTRRFNEIMTSTGMSAELLQFLSTFPVTQEAMNVGRRGESSQALQMLMALLGGTRSNFDYTPYLQGLMTQYGQPGGGSSMDWLAYLPFLLNMGTGSRIFG